MSLKKIISIIGATFLFVLIGSITFLVRGEGKQEKADEAEKQEQQITRPPVEEAQGDNLGFLDESRSSWPGELISYSTVEVHSLSDGILKNLTVRVGQRVAQGEAIASLSSPPASVERAMASAERVSMLVKAQANEKATAKVVLEQIAQLEKARESLVPSRESTVSISEKEAQLAKQKEANAAIELDRMRNEKDATIAYVTKELEQTKTKLELQDLELRTFVEQLIDSNLFDLTVNNTNYTPLTFSTLAHNKNISIRFRSPVLNDERFAYQGALLRAIVDVESKSSAINASALAYAATLVNYSRTLVADDDYITDQGIDKIRMNAREQQMDVVKMTNELRDLKSMVESKRADLAKMVAEKEKEITLTELMITNSRIESESSELAKKKMTVDSQFEYLNRKREIDIKIIELKRELELARAEVKAAKASYTTFTRELASQRIIAQKGGIVTAIQKNVGDFVMPSDTIVVISSSEQDSIFVRFRIPNDATAPEAGTEVVVMRPGFPFEKKEAVITGIGTSLSEGEGAYIGEAEFVEELSWPVNAQVRVSLKELEEKIFVPFVAVRWDEEQKAHLTVVQHDGSLSDRVVQTGRAIGDRIEIVGGLEKGEQYISGAMDSKGMGNGKILLPDSKKNDEESSDSGHGGHSE